MLGAPEKVAYNFKTLRVSNFLKKVPYQEQTLDFPHRDHSKVRQFLIKFQLPETKTI